MAKKYKGFKNPNWKKNNSKPSIAKCQAIGKLLARAMLSRYGIDCKY